MPWYRSGLKFKCVGISCSNCCTAGNSGSILSLTEEDLLSISKFLGISIPELLKSRGLGEKFTRFEKGERCPFSTEKGCEIYPYRPKYCKKWPFTKNTLRTAANWEAAKEFCPGIGSGTFYTCEEVLRKIET